MITSRRVLHLIDLLDEYRAAVVLRELIPRLVEANCLSSVVALRCTRQGRAHLRAAGINVRVLCRRWSVDPIAAVRLRDLLDGRPIDVVHCWDAASLAYLAAATLRCQTPPVVLSVDAAQARSTGAAWILRATGSRVARVLASDPQAVAWCSDCGVPECRIALSPVDVAFNPSTSVAREEFNERLDLPPGGRTIAVAGQLHRDNHVDEAVWRYELIRLLHPETRLVVCGDGAERRRLERFIRLASDADAVRVVGYRDDFRELLPHFDALFCCRVVGAVPRSLWEAMGAGVPVVACDCAAVRSAIVHGENGLLAPAENRAEFVRCTDRIFRDAELAARIKAAGVKTINDRFGVDRAVGDVLQAYETAHSAVQAE